MFLTRVWGITPTSGPLSGKGGSRRCRAKRRYPTRWRMPGPWSCHVLVNVLVRGELGCWVTRTTEAGTWASTLGLSRTFWSLSLLL